MQELGLEALPELLGRIDTLAVLDGVLKNDPSHAVLELLRLLTRPPHATHELSVAYARAFGALASTAHQNSVADVDDAWQAQIIMNLVQNENPWTAQAERGSSSRVTTQLRSRVRYELRILQELFCLSAHAIAKATATASGSQDTLCAGAWEPWIRLSGTHVEPGILTSFTELCAAIAAADDWGELPDLLEPYWHRHGAGPLARFRSVQWLGVTLGLQGVAHPDSAQLSELFGYQRQQQLLRRNTERFLAGLPAHDALLYGRPGTGKSSTVKAVANEYAEQGLRLLELAKETFFDLPTILRSIRYRGCRYLLFIDDLSFEENQVEYKALKVLLEGAVEARPQNVLVYATTNRLNLIREAFTDRGNRADDVHWRDTMDEKVALGERFGLRLTFHTPDKPAYLEIATGLARHRGIELPDPEIQMRAIRWANNHQNTRSGRLARQFVDDLEAELGDRKRAKALSG